MLFVIMVVMDNNANIEYDAGFHNFLTGTGGTERMRIDSSGQGCF